MQTPTRSMILHNHSYLHNSIDSQLKDCPIILKKSNGVGYCIVRYSIIIVDVNNMILCKITQYLVRN